MMMQVRQEYERLLEEALARTRRLEEKVARKRERERGYKQGLALLRQQLGELELSRAQERVEYAAQLEKRQTRVEQLEEALAQANQMRIRA
jgi:hypothetical protein